MLEDLSVVYRVGSLVGLTDHQLLERFQSAVSSADHAAAEAALTALVERHAAMVWNVCRSVVRDRHAAEDAFQATFLILVRKAGSLRVGETMGPWLHVVAYRTALSLRAATARRREVERSAAAMLSEVVEAVDDDGSSLPEHEIRAAIHAEIMKLPESFRAVVLLCDLEGLGYLEAASRLNIPLGTVQSRLARARRRLRQSLTLRGISRPGAGEEPHAPGAAFLGSLTVSASAPSLTRRIARVAALVASDPAALKTSVAGPVQALIKGGLRSMLLVKLRRVLVASLGGVLAGGTLLYANARSGQTEPPAGRQAKATVEVKRRIEMPAPRGLKVASGRGKALVYAVDDMGVRIPEHLGAHGGPFRRPSGRSAGPWSRA